MPESSFKPYAWPVFVVLSALAIAVGIMLLLNLRPAAETLPDVALQHSDGAALDLAGLAGRTWVAGFVSAGCAESCDESRARLVALRGRLRPEVDLVSFAAASTAASRFDVPPQRAGGRWLVTGGEREARDALASGYLGFARDDLAWLAGEPDGLLLASVDRSGRVHRRYRLAPSGTSAAANLDAVVADGEFLTALAARPAWHARLNATSALLLTAGFLFIRRRMIRWHLVCMVLASLSTLGFLVSYLQYHYYAGSMPFRGEGLSRPLYLGILLTHTVLAAFVGPLALSLLFHAARRNFSRHRKIARWTLPLWLYVSITGVLIYCMLYVWFGGG